MTSVRMSILRPVALAMALGLAVSLPVRAADSSEISRAENLVFVDAQLGNLKPPTSLRYSYVKSGSLEPGFEDNVRIDVQRGSGAVCCAVQGDFLSGDRKISLPDIVDAKANPVVLFFLERDIREMERLTKGKANYFRKRIRMGMAEDAKIRDTRISYNGRELPAQEVTLAPYETDPLRSRFEKYAQKRYVFVLAGGVPGGVYQVRTALPGALPTDAPVQEEIMTLVGAETLALPTKKK